MPQARNPTTAAPHPAATAAARFTGRAAETGRILDLLRGPAGSPLPLVMFYGVGGAGKSSLLAHLGEACSNMRIPWALVDLAQAGTTGRALPRLAAMLQESAGLRFPSFVRALAVLAARDAPDPDQRLSGRLPSRFRGIDSASEVVLAGLGLIPVVGQLAAVAKISKQAGRLAFQQAMRRRSFRQAIERIGGEGDLIDLSAMSDEELDAELIRRFAADLMAALPEVSNQSGRAALLFDTHEALWRDAAGGAFAEDAWLRTLREYLHSQGVLMVVAGRDRLRWPPDWDERDSAGRALWLEQRALNGLSEPDARDLLQRSLGDDVPRSLADAVLRVSNEEMDACSPSRHHCYLLALCAEAIAGAKASGDGYPPAGAFAGIPAGEAAAAPLAQRFLTSMPSEAMAGWLQEIALTPRFDQDYALALDSERRYLNGRSGWQRLCELSLIARSASGMLVLHPLLRQALVELIPDERAAPVHTWAAEYWRRRSDQPAHANELDYLGLAWYHQRFCDRSAAMQELERLREQGFQQGRPGVLQQLLDWWQPVALLEAPAGVADALDLEAYGRLLERFARLSGRRSSLLPRAIDCYRRALRTLDPAVAANEWAQIQDALGRALLDLPTGNRDSNVQGAIESLVAALQVRTETANPEQWAETMNTLGIAYRSLQTGDRAEHLRQAIACYEATLRVWTESDAPAKWAQEQTNIGEACKDLPTGDQSVTVGRAIGCYEDALLVVNEREAPFQWAGLQNNLANALVSLVTPERRRNLQRAIECYLAAMRVWTEEAHPDHWALAQSNLGDAYRQLAANGERPRESLRLAIKCFDAALRVHTEADHPLSWAIAQHNRAAALTALAARMSTSPPPRMEGKGEGLLVAAVDGFLAARRVFTEASYPRFWALNEEQLGQAYGLMADVEHASTVRVAAVRSAEETA